MGTMYPGGTASTPEIPPAPNSNNPQSSRFVESTRHTPFCYVLLRAGSSSLTTVITTRSGHPEEMSSAWLQNMNINFSRLIYPLINALFLQITRHTGRQ